MLEQFGFTDTEESLYLLLLEAPELAIDDLASAVQGPAVSVRPMLDRLAAAGLVHRRPGRPVRYSAVDPDAALAPLIAARRQQVDYLRTVARRLGRQYRAMRSRRDPLDLVEVVVGAPGYAECLSQLRTLAKSELRGMDKPPYAGADDVRPVNGVRVRSIYDRAALDAPDIVERILDGRAGCDGQVRVIGEAPFHLRVADDRRAVLALPGRSAAAPAGALVVHPSPLLEGMLSLFETLWRYAVPLRADDVAAGGRTDRPTPMQALMLPFMAAGMTDEAVARHLSVSLRTVQRQTRTMLDRLGAKTRFQAALHARNRGWL